MKNGTFWCVLLTAATLAATAAEPLVIDLTGPKEATEKLGKGITNIEILPGADGGIAAAEPGKAAGFQIAAPTVFDKQAGYLELTVSPVVDMSFYADGSKVNSMTLMEIVWPQKKNWRLGAVIAPKYQIATATFNGKSSNIPIWKWKRGETHTITIRWNDSGKKLTAEADGKVFAQADNDIMFDRPYFINLSGYNNTAFLIRRVKLGAGTGQSTGK